MSTGEGIYFHPESLALSRVEDGFLDLGSGWVRISDDVSLGLLAARKLIEEGGLAADTASIDWLEMSAPDAEQRRRVSRVIREFKADSVRLRETNDEKPGFLRRLIGGLGSGLRPGTP